MSEWLLIPLGFAVGTYGTLIGAGGGFVLVPILLFLYPHDKPSVITGISLAVVFFNATSGSIAYARERRIDFRSGIVFAIATIPGAILGALVVELIPRNIFDGLFGAVLLIMAAVVIWRPQSTRPSTAPPLPGMTTRVKMDEIGRA